jgi:hypothetical protein
MLNNQFGRGQQLPQYLDEKALFVAIAFAKHPYQFAKHDTVDVTGFFSSAAVLDEVGRYPGLLRFVLKDVSDEDIGIKSVHGHKRHP